MICRACSRPALRRASAHGLCMGCALLFQLGPWVTVEAFVNRRKNDEAA
jgi:hypothetical protein